MLQERFQPTTFSTTLQGALTTKPSLHVTTKNDIAKYMNTYIEPKNDFLNITI
jgi:hypothetical protein